MAKNNKQSAPTRRDFLYVSTSAMAVVGVAAVAWPFIAQMNPDAAVLALASTEVDLSSIEIGSSVTIKWRGAPVFIRRRSGEEISEAQAVDFSDMKDPASDSERVLEGHEEWLIMVANCTHLGCIPQEVTSEGAFGGWQCKCHGSIYDTAGRIVKGPAPANLVVPDYEFLSDTLVKIG